MCVCVCVCVCDTGGEEAGQLEPSLFVRCPPLPTSLSRPHILQLQQCLKGTPVQTGQGQQRALGLIVDTNEFVRCTSLAGRNAAPALSETTRGLTPLHLEHELFFFSLSLSFFFFLPSSFTVIFTSFFPVPPLSHSLFLDTNRCSFHIHSSQSLPPTLPTLLLFVTLSFYNLHQLSFVWVVSTVW